jgi:hypothetical protein
MLHLMIEYLIAISIVFVLIYVAYKVLKYLILVIVLFLMLYLLYHFFNGYIPF